MKHLATLEGTGRLIVPPNIEASAQYQIRVYSSKRGRRSAHGTIELDPVVLQRAFDSNRCVLELVDGQTVKIVIAQVGTTSSTFRVNGPIPGFS